MNTLKHYKKNVSLVVIFSFLFLVEASSLPLRAEPIRASGDDMIPGSIEQEGGSSFLLYKKSTIIPVIIGLVALGAVVTMFILAVSNNYDIRGVWHCVLLQTQPESKTLLATLFFIGDSRKSGPVVYDDDLGENEFRGTYSVDGRNVSMTFKIDSTNTLTLVGKFDTKKKMSGTWSTTLNTMGTWIAIFSIR